MVPPPAQTPAQPRRYIRHPADVPLEVSIERDGSAHTLANVGAGGVAFASTRAYAPGTTVRLRIACVRPPFETCAHIAWCRADAAGYIVGVAFASEAELYAARMVEQLCYIERYKNEVLQKEGRVLSGQEAALEWIQKYAGEFPSLDGHP